MQLHADRLAEFFRRYGLAIACVAAPLLLSLGVFSLAQQAIIAVSLHPDSPSRIVFHYEPALASDELGPQPAVPPSAASSTATPRAAPDDRMFLPARHYAGRASFAMASSFLFVVSLTTLIFAAVIIHRRWGWKGVIGAFAVWATVAVSIALLLGNPHGRYLVVRDLLDAADKFPGLQAFVFYWKDQFPFLSRDGYVPTGTVAETFVHINTIVSLIPVGMLLTALAILSVRDAKSRTEAVLKSRLTQLRCALLLGSTCFVVGVLSNKALVEWPLQLIRQSQAKALRPLADSLVLQFGAVGTTAIFAAFAPAIIAWMLDAHAMTKKAAGKKPPDEFVFAPLSTIAAIVAVLAPVLASPVVDSLKSLAGGIAK